MSFRRIAVSTGRFIKKLSVLAISCAEGSKLLFSQNTNVFQLSENLSKIFGLNKRLFWLTIALVLSVVNYFFLASRICYWILRKEKQSEELDNSNLLNVFIERVVENYQNVCSVNVDIDRNKK